MTGMNSKLFNPNVSFFNLKIVWGTFFFIVVIALTLIAIANYGSNNQFCGSTECYNNFITKFKLPLGILSLLIPIGAIFAVQHRSEQSIAQIKASEGQNNFVNYYKHLDEFEKYLKSRAMDGKVRVNQIHAEIFQESRDGNFDVTYSIQKYIEINFSKIYILLKSIEKESKNGLENNELMNSYIRLIESIFNDLQKRLHIIQSKSTLAPIIIKSLTLSNVNHKINYFKSETVRLIDILSYCHTYTPPASMQAISKLPSEVSFTELKGLIIVGALK